MTEKSANSNSAGNLSRCLHRYPSGRRCRFPLADTSSYFCDGHAHLQPPGPDSTDLSPDLVGNLADFTSAADINQVLSKLLILLSQNRISPRRAAVIAYISSLLLRTLPAIEHELHPESDEDDHAVVVWDLPPPNRSPLADVGEPVPETPCAENASTAD